MLLKDSLKQGRLQIDAVYFDSQRRTPEENLLVAVLDRAIRDLFLKGKMEDARSAYFYFINRNPRDYGSFRFFCEHFGYSWQALSRKILDSVDKEILIQATKSGRATHGSKR